MPTWWPRAGWRRGRGWACTWRRRASACLFNTSKLPQKDLGLKIRGLEHGLDPTRPLAEPPTVLVETALPIPGELAPDSGRRVSVELDEEARITLVGPAEEICEGELRL